MKTKVKTDSLIMRISPELKEQIKQHAAEDRKTVSEWITDLIKLEIADKSRGSGRKGDR